jgi:SMODS and SLOG-associating 2TM effector domain 1
VSDERQRQFLSLYGRWRADDQLRWYAARLDEFNRARAQAITLTGILLILTTTSSALAAADAAGQRTLWAVLATLFPALSTALAAYVALHGYHRVAKLYDAAAGSLRGLRVDQPRAPPASEFAEQEKLGEYVASVEGILRREQGQWGQLASEARRPPPGEDGAS